MDMLDFRGAVIDDLERGRAALSLVDRLARFVRGLRDEGFGVGCDVVHSGVSHATARLTFDIPAGLMADAPAPEIVEPARARPAPLSPEPASQTLPPLGERKPASEPATERRAADDYEDVKIVEMRVDSKSIDKIAKQLRRSKSFIHGRIEGPLAARIAALSDQPRHNLPYDDAEDARMVEMAAGGMTAIEIAGEVGRTQAAVVYRCCKVLADRISAAKVAAKEARAAISGPDAEIDASRTVKDGLTVACAADAQLDAPEPVQPQPEPVPTSEAKADLPTPVSQPAPVPVAAVSPVAGMRAEDMTGQLVRAHLCWLYGPAPDRDQMQGDLELIELLLTTGSAAQVALEFDWPKEQVLARWQELRGCQGVTLDLQRYMLDALREMLREVAE